MVVLLTYVLCPRKNHVSHLTSAARLACSAEVRGSGSSYVSITQGSPRYQYPARLVVSYLPYVLQYLYCAATI
jgi:hypothetical protein